MSGRALLALVFILVGLVAVAAGVIYLTQPAHTIPSFFPGYGAHLKGKYVHRGEAGVGVGVVLVVVGAVVALAARSRSTRWS